MILEEESHATGSTKNFNKFIGQERIVTGLEVYIKAAKLRHDPLDHILLYGQPGMGKTLLANTIADEMGVNIKSCSAYSIVRAGDLTAILTNLNENDILYIDQIHLLNHAVEAELYTAMEDFCLDIILGKGTSANSIRIDLPRFTMIGETKSLKSLSKTLLDRFEMQIELGPYTPEELTSIIIRSADDLDIQVEKQAAKLLAYNSSGTPRTAIKILRRARDFAQAMNGNVVTCDVAEKTLYAMGIEMVSLED